MKNKHGNYKHGKYTKNYKSYCIDCGKKISNLKKRCVICCRKGYLNSMFGISKSGFRNSNYKDGRCSKKYYCLTCNIEICYKTWKEGSKKCLSCSRKGCFHYKWKGGITLLHQQIRSLREYSIWRKSVFKRDNYTCQECRDNKGGNLEAHHNINSFSIILSEFFKLYNQFSPIEDKNIMLRLASKYDSFWDINNGITLCEGCHKQNYNKINKIKRG